MTASQSRLSWMVLGAECKVWKSFKIRCEDCVVPFLFLSLIGLGGNVMVFICRRFVCVFFWGGAQRASFVLFDIQRKS